MSTATPTFTPSAPLIALMAGVRASAQKHTSVDWAAVMVNAPLFVLTYGILTLSTDDTRALGTTAMSDDWVRSAAALPTASTKNLRKLQQAFDAKGFVSIAVADRFCTVELARERQLAEMLAREQALSVSAGYGALMARLAGEGFEPTFDEALSTLKGYASELSKAGAGLVSLTAEAAASARRRVDAAASVVGRLLSPLSRG